MGNEEEEITERYKRDQVRRETGFKPYSHFGYEDSEYAEEIVPKEVDNEEFASETAVQENSTSRLYRTGNDHAADRTQNKSIGWLAIVIAFVSLFVWPVILGPIAVILGVFAFTRRMRALGTWSIAIGLISLVSYIVLVPFYT